MRLASGDPAIAGFLAHDLVPPAAPAMIEALRALGYSPGAAVADLVDNAISAGARRIGVELGWNGPDSTLSVLDDGQGMDREGLVQAMRAGSRDPRDVRGARDLGRFGMGLKTASFSQCRRLTVASRTAGGALTVRRWDLDHVTRTGEWQLLHGFHSGSEHHVRALDTMDRGTLVLWECMDRLAGEQAPGGEAFERARDRFWGQARAVEEHLALTFHTFLTGRGAVTLELNGQPVRPWDPLLRDWDAVELLPEERLHLDGHVIRVQGSVLPHPSRLGPAQLAEARGHGGWNRHQGFHIYRLGRLLVDGGWLNLRLERDDRFRLARVRVDLPPELDLAWGVDIRKSRVSVPAVLREDLRRVAQRTRELARRVHAHRVRPTRGTGERHTLWEEVSNGVEHRQRLRRDHPLIAALREQAPQARETLDALLRLLEATVPVERVLATGPDPEQGTVPVPPEFRTLLGHVRQALLRSSLSAAQVEDRLRLMEPFCNHPELFESVH